MKFLSFLLLFSSQAFAANVLFIGDSHSVGPFGWELDKHLRSYNDSIVATYASCGSIAKWWYTGQPTTCGYYQKDMSGVVNSGTKLATPIFNHLMDTQKPDLVVVELGANYANLPSDTYAINDMKQIVNKIKDSKAKCFWITKPDSRNGRENIPRILRITTEAAKDYCTIFDSTKVTKYPATGGDGVHYWFKEGTPIAKEWALKVFEALKPVIQDIEQR